jgi:hypothetical protein
LGEIVSEGTLADDEGRVLARFRQRVRAWLGRPALELRIELTPEPPPQGYPWHAYFGSRFAWADERAALLRGVNGAASVTSLTRPETPEYLDVRLGRAATLIFPGGLPFHQRHGGRMLDVLLVTPGETARVFELTLALDREYPAQTALGLATPAVVVPTAKGPPHVGATGWLYHLDLPSVTLLGMRPAEGGEDGVVARLLEVGGHSGQAELRCVRNPTRAALCNALGEGQLELSLSGDAVLFDAAQGEVVHVRIDYS